MLLGNADGARGEILISGSGAFTNTAGLSLGAVSGGYGSIQVSGGSWVQSGALNVGAGSGGTGEVTVANTVQTNITGAVRVGGAGYGLLTISNATFKVAPSTVRIDTNGFVELTGTSRLFQVNALVVTNGGSVATHIRVAAGGIDVTNSLPTALIVTNGGHIHLSFEQNPEPIGDFWGLRWAGNNHAAALQALTNDARLTWSDAGLTPQWRNRVGIYTNSTTTFVGFNYTGIPGSVYKFR
jgi:hypothetical protein